MVVVAIKPAGVICEENKEWLDDIEKRLIVKTGDTKAWCYLVQIISMEIQKYYNAAWTISARSSKEE